MPAFRRALGWLRSYAALWAVVGVALVVSFPGWYPPDSLLQSVMANIFATFAVTPVLVFGVESVIRRVEELRERPRRAAALEELAASLFGVVASLAAIRSIDTILPGAVAKLAAGFPRPTEVSDENALFMSDWLVDEVVARRGEVEERFRDMSLSDLGALMKAAGDQASEIRERLFEAERAVRPDLHARVVKLLRDVHRLGSNANLVAYIADRGYRPSSPESEAALREAFVKLYLRTVDEAVLIYRQVGAVR